MQKNNTKLRKIFPSILLCMLFFVADQQAGRPRRSIGDFLSSDQEGSSSDRNVAEVSGREPLSRDEVPGHHQAIIDFVDSRTPENLEDNDSHMPENQSEGVSAHGNGVFDSVKHEENGREREEHDVGLVAVNDEPSDSHEQEEVVVSPIKTPETMIKTVTPSGGYDSSQSDSESVRLALSDDKKHKTISKEEALAVTRVSADASPHVTNGLPFIISNQPKPIFIHHPTMPAFDDDATIEFQFQDADLQNLLDQVADFFKITLLSDDMLNPIVTGGKAVKGNKITFRTNKPLKRQEAWNLFLNFLDIAQLTIVPQMDSSSVFRVVPITSSIKTAPLPVFIGVSPESLPDNAQFIRYLYFVKNLNVESLTKIIDSLRNSNGGLLILTDLNAFVVTDRSYNIRSLMKIVTELDRATLPQSMSVLKLRRADAEQVASLYQTLVKSDDVAMAGARIFPQKKSSDMVYFSDAVKMIVEPRTNSLILLGAADAIRKVEEFITAHIDVELAPESFSPLRVYQLQYADAKTVTEIMNKAVDVGHNSAVGKAGGVKDGDRYIKSLKFFSEATTNSIIAKGEEEDWLQALEIIKNLDEPQPQVAIEALILTVTLDDTRGMGAQIRNKDPLRGGGISGLAGQNVSFQTSGINFGMGASPFATNTSGPGSTRLLGNLMQLVKSGVTGVGNTIIQLGSDVFGVWGLFNILNTITNLQVVSNPFLITGNKQRAKIQSGLIRRVTSSTVVAGNNTQTNALADDPALLRLEVTPTINSDGMISLKVNIGIEDFTILNDPASGDKTIREVSTYAVLANKEVLAIGGLIRNDVSTQVSKVPVLGSIPIIGWLFKNEIKTSVKQSLLILISTHILPIEQKQGTSAATLARINEYHGDLDAIHNVINMRDPIDRAFFSDSTTETENIVNDYIFNDHVAHHTIHQALGEKKQVAASSPVDEKRSKKEKKPKTTREYRHRGHKQEKKKSKKVAP